MPLLQWHRIALLGLVPINGARLTDNVLDKEYETAEADQRRSCFLSVHVVTYSLC